MSHAKGIVSISSTIQEVKVKANPNTASISKIKNQRVNQVIDIRIYYIKHKFIVEILRRMQAILSISRLLIGTCVKEHSKNLRKINAQSTWHNYPTKRNLTKLAHRRILTSEIWWPVRMLRGSSTKATWKERIHITNSSFQKNHQDKSKTDHKWGDSCLAETQK